MKTSNLKTQLCDALAAFIRMRPGLKFGNYGDHASYAKELRGITRDKRDAELLLARVRGETEITDRDLLEAAQSAFSGRLSIETHAAEAAGRWDIKIDYCTGQYWPTEYRKAVAAVCASALWQHKRDHHETSGSALRNSFRREFGSALQKRWFE